MKDLSHLLENNRRWAEKRDPSLFKRDAEGQSPKYLWIGCSDSRVPPNEILGLGPGEVFVHRNIANLATPNDLNIQSVLQVALEFLKIEHIIICGHYGCSGAQTATKEATHGVVDEWLAPVRELYAQEQSDWKTLVERNVLLQANNIMQSSFVSEAMSIHAWVYDISTGLIKDLRFK